MPKYDDQALTDLCRQAFLEFMSATRVLLDAADRARKLHDALLAIPTPESRATEAACAAAKTRDELLSSRRRMCRAWKLRGMNPTVAWALAQLGASSAEDLAARLADGTLAEQKHIGPHRLHLARVWLEGHNAQHQSKE